MLHVRWLQIDIEHLRKCLCLCGHRSSCGWKNFCHHFIDCISILEQTIDHVLAVTGKKLSTAAVLEEMVERDMLIDSNCSNDEAEELAEVLGCGPRLSPKFKRLGCIGI
jgi:hypothetical protein